MSVGVVMSSLEGVQREHRQLSQYIGESSVQLEALNQRYQGRASGHSARSQEAIGSEVSVCVCVCACVHACVRACVCVCVILYSPAALHSVGTATRTGGPGQEESSQVASLPTLHPPTPTNPACDSMERGGQGSE